MADMGGIWILLHQPEGGISALELGTRQEFLERGHGYCFSHLWMVLRVTPSSRAAAVLLPAWRASDSCSFSFRASNDTGIAGAGARVSPTARSAANISSNH